MTAKGLKSKENSDNGKVIEEIIIKKEKKAAKRDLLYCKWCRIQDNRSFKDKKKLGDNLKGNSRHLQLFCEHEDIKKLRDNISSDMEFKLWHFLELVKIGEDPINLLTQLNLFLIEINNPNERDSPVPYKYKHNYISLSDSLKIRNLDNILEGRRKQIIILCYIWGFNTALQDGELCNNEVTPMEQMYTGVIAKPLEEWMKHKIKVLSQKNKNFSHAKFNIKEHVQCLERCERITET